MVEHKKYWSAAIMCSPEPMADHYSMVARDMDDCMAGAGKLDKGYVKHLLQWWDDTQGITLVVACCTVGALQASLTSRKEFKEIPWPAQY